MQFYKLLGGTNISLINNLMLLNYDKRYMLFNEYHLAYLCMLTLKQFTLPQTRP